MKGITTNLRRGDWVEVLKVDEISATLDRDGTLDGLPFMPEMIPFCGQRCQVSSRVVKLCVETDHGYEMREFPGDDVVILENVRCAGDAHGDCPRGCNLLWKAAWIRNAPSPGMPAVVAKRAAVPGSLAFKTREDSGRYFCQSSQIAAATSFLPVIRRITKSFRNLRYRTCGPIDLARWFAVPVWFKLRHKVFGPLVRGSGRQTPSDSLNLQPGEWVEVKSLEEIKGTLDQSGRNRGLVFDAGMSRFCGRRFQVRSRVDSMIMETTGMMRAVKNTVLLENVTCCCVFAVGGCPRKDLLYWREIWLKRVSENDSTAVPAGKLMQ